MRVCVCVRVCVRERVRTGGAHGRGAWCVDVQTLTLQDALNHVRPFISNTLATH